METNQQMQEILFKLEKTGRQQVRCARLQCFFAILAAVMTFSLSSSGI